MIYVCIARVPRKKIEVERVCERNKINYDITVNVDMLELTVSRVNVISIKKKNRNKIRNSVL